MSIKSYNDIYTVYAWQDNNRTFTVTTNEGGIKHIRLILKDKQDTLDLSGDEVSVHYAATKPNGKEVLVTANKTDATNGTIEFPVESALTTNHGLVVGEVRVVTPLGVLKFHGINLNVHKGVSDKAAEQAEAFTALIDALRKLSAIQADGSVAVLDDIEEFDSGANGRLNPMASGVVYEILQRYVLNDTTIADMNLKDDITVSQLQAALKTYPVIIGDHPPTTSTKGKLGQMYYYIDDGALYICRGLKGSIYIWENISPVLTDAQISTALSEYLKEHPIEGAGANGIGIEKAEVNSDGELVLTYSDGNVETVGKVVGTDGNDGEDGADGYSPKISVSETETGYDITISHTGNTVEKISINHGVDGKNGADGQDGKTPVLGVDYFTESDKANIVSSVIDSLGGNPVFGVVDENNNIVVSGNLPDGTYTVKYELEDGTTVSIGDLVLTEDNPDSGDSGEEIPTYTNLAQPNTDNTTDFTIWCNNARMGGDGSVTARDGYTVTNYVALSNGDTFRVKGFKIERVGLFSANKTALSSGVGNLANLQTNQYVEGGYSQTDEETTFTAKNSNIAYARLSGWVNNTVDDVIITKNEEIV